MMDDAKSGKTPGSKSGKSAMTASGTNMKDFRLEYAKSGASKCGVCEEKIKKVSKLRWIAIFSWQIKELTYDFFFQNEVRAGKKEYESQRAKMYGPYDKWHHLDCFVKVRLQK